MPGENHRISGLELASRLSYFLWSAGPDQELIKIASEGGLQEPEILERQVKRMLADPRSKSLSTRFAKSPVLSINTSTGSGGFPLLDSTISSTSFAAAASSFSSFCSDFVIAACLVAACVVAVVHVAI